MRRNLVMQESRIPGRAGAHLPQPGAERQPVAVQQRRRAANWADGPGHRRRSPRWRTWPRLEYLYWVGCLGSFDERNQKISRALAAHPPGGRRRVRHPGQEEPAPATRPAAPATSTSTRCWPRPTSRRMNELQGDQASSPPARTASTRSRTSTRSSAATTRCMHHTEFIDYLIKAGRIKLGAARGADDHLPRPLLPRPLQRRATMRRAKCLRRIPGVNLVEMKRSRETALLLRRRRRAHVAGRARGPAHEPEPHHRRAGDRRRHPGLRCPFCTSMFEDGIKGQGVESNLRCRTWPNWSRPAWSRATAAPKRKHQLLISASRIRYGRRNPLREPAPSVSL